MIQHQEIADVLGRVARGEAAATCKGRGWDDTWAGDVVILADGWKIVIFNACDDLDYVDSVTAPDGRHADWDELCAIGECAGRDAFNLHTKYELKALERVLKAAPAKVTP